MEIPRRLQDDNGAAECEEREMLPLESKGMTIARWTAAAYREAKVRYPEAPPPSPLRLGRRWFSHAQCIAVGMLMVRYRLTVSETVALFRERPDLRRVLRLRHPPSRWWCWRARYGLTEGDREAANSGAIGNGAASTTPELSNS
jgi:hypothetical protein